ncbi:MAG: hypothetical protein K6A69_06185 [Lachnospiraceae bacterium]|nr:hypothetical protein [Lachnospiraceae bacterium]
MEIEEISSDNAEDFLSILGPDIVDDMKRVFYRGLGVMGDSSEPEGVLIYELVDAESDKDTKSHVVMAKYNSPEAGKAVQKLYKEDYVYEENIIESFYESEDEKLADDFATEGFSKDKKESDVVKISLKDTAGLDLVKKGNPPSYVKSIIELSVAQYRTAIKACLFKGHKGVLEDLAYLPMTWFEREVSACSITDGNVDGLFLVRATPSGVLIPVLFFATGPDSVKRLAYMLIYSIKKALEKYPPETEVIISRTKKASKEMIKKLLPEVKGDEVFFGSRKE